MSAKCKTWPNLTAALGALNAVRATWVAPAIAWVNCAGPVRSRLANKLGALAFAGDPFELKNGRGAVVADHPGFKGEVITGADRVQAAEPAAKQGVK